MIHTLTRQPDAHEFELVKKYVQDFWLDDTNMRIEQFRVLLKGNELIAFGRVRENPDATELCTIGVVQELRGKGYGSEITNALLKEVKRDAYIVTVIPDFFAKLGFKPVSEYPPSIQAKCNLCTSQYHVGEEYRVMKWSYN
jgi:N-acetylglutamate synthase-like GNAT family acetyltransferase